MLFFGELVHIVTNFNAIYIISRQIEMIYSIFFQFIEQNFVNKYIDVLTDICCLAVAYILLLLFD